MGLPLIVLLTSAMRCNKRPHRRHHVVSGTGHLLPLGDPAVCQGLFGRHPLLWVGLEPQKMAKYDHGML